MPPKVLINEEGVDLRETAPTITVAADWQDSGCELCRAVSQWGPCPHVFRFWVVQNELDSKFYAICDYDDEGKVDSGRVCGPFDVEDIAMQNAMDVAKRMAETLGFTVTQH